MQQNKLLKTIILICGVFILCFATSIYIFAWTGPTEDPPGGDVSSIVKLAPDTIQSDASSTPSIWINKTAIGNLLDLQSGGASQLIVGYDGNVIMESGKLSLKEAIAPGASAGYGRLYVASADSKLYFKDDSGIEYDLTAPGGASQLTDLSNVTIAAPADNEVLTYELSTGLWKNAPGGAGGGIGGSGASTQIAFFSDSTTLGSDSDLYWDNVNKRLGVGISTPNASIETRGGAHGIMAYGTTAGGFFSDFDSYGYAYLGVGDYGIKAYSTGTTPAGFFQNNNSGTYTRVADDDRGIDASATGIAVGGWGDIAGGYFQDRNASGYAYAGYGDYGIQGYGNSAGGYFDEIDTVGTYAYLAFSDYGVYAKGNTSGGYFKDNNSSGYAYVGYGDYGVKAYGDTMGGYFKDLTSGVYSYLGHGDYGLYTPLGNVYVGGDLRVGTTTAVGALHLTGGALAVDGNTGTAGQVLTSQGATATPNWADAGGGGDGQAIYDAIVDVAGSGDYTTVQDAVNAGEKSIFIKDGAYSIGAVLNITTAGTHLYGESVNGVQIGMPNVHSLTINVSASDVIFENITLYKAWNTSLVTWAGSNGSIINCSFENRYATAGSYAWPVLSGTFNEIYVENSKFSSTQGYVVGTGGSNNVFTGNTFETTGWGGELLSLGQNSRVIGNYFLAINAAGNSEYGANLGNNSVVTGNIFQGALGMASNYAAIAADNSVITDNMITGFYDGIWSGSGTNGSVVNNNVIRNVARDGIRVDGGCNTGYSGIEVVGNSINNSGQDGIVASPGCNLTISDNNIKGSGRYGIRGDYDFRRSVISNNNIRENIGGGIVMDSGEYFEDSIVTNNVIYNNGGYAIDAGRIYYSVFMGNVIRNNTNNQIYYPNGTLNSEIQHNVIY